MTDEDGRSGLVRVILVWIIGMAIGVGAGALTARLLIPRGPAIQEAPVDAPAEDLPAS